MDEGTKFSNFPLRSAWSLSVLVLWWFNGRLTLLILVGCRQGAVDCCSSCPGVVVDVDGFIGQSYRVERERGKEDVLGGVVMAAIREVPECLAVLAAPLAPMTTDMALAML